MTPEEPSGDARRDQGTGSPQLARTDRSSDTHSAHHISHAAHPGGHSHHEHPGGLRRLLTSVLRPHSHDAGSSVDTALKASHEGMTALKMSLIGLGITAALQVAIFAISGSVALLADTIHNFADALTAVPLGLAFWLARRPPSRRYTYGYGRAEDLAGVFIVLTVAASAALAGWAAVNRLIHPQHISHLGWVIAAGLVGVAGNELVAHYRIRVGRRIGSAALEADGHHARTDGITSLGVVLGALGVAAGWQAADPVFGLIITVAILVVVKNAARDIYRRLIDAVDPALVDRISAVLEAVPGIEEVEAVRVRWVGHELHAEADVVSDADLSLSRAHDIAEQARHRLLHDVRRLSSATIHSSPCRHHGADPHALTAHHFNSG